ncbi:MAG: 1-acyl-sn-glycerol-3-phosphate acyltransferase [Dysgonamonadaceae bacterium]|nr:1-acyl-sn-glycerol-3-phosphate acyltransferase [Dysgonamonadaceae bacterium]MDD4728750.1 1-acyl-sn-glycerol-3-phosphate acyltransferase [Dysgonamonadaceae bacterium]
MMESNLKKIDNDTYTDTHFDDIRPLKDSEVREAIDFLLNDVWFKKIVEPLISPIPWKEFAEKLNRCENILDFQENVIYTIIFKFLKGSVDKLWLANPPEIDLNERHLYISNHRDIILDAGLFNILLYEKGYETTEIAIGDNLLIYPWITTLVRLNKSFIVKRDVPVRQVLDVSKHLSEYIHKTIAKEKQSVWIAQREGRAKDSNDRTQTSLLKMLTLVDRKNPLKSFETLNMVPLSISYEYDPNDFLKAKEFQLRRDFDDYKKTDADDLVSMFTGIEGYKGKVCFKLGKPLNEKIHLVSETKNRTEILEEVANLIDEEIFRNYEMFPPNYIAYDLSTKSNKFADKYTFEEKNSFIEYVNKQVAKIKIENKDDDFLKNSIIEMYANTLINHLSVL